MDPIEARRLLDADANEELLSRISPEEMADAWCRYATRSMKVEETIEWEADEDGWAAELCHEQAFLESEPFRRAFLAALADAASDEILGWVGAGPIEDFVNEGGPGWIKAAPGILVRASPPEGVVNEDRLVWIEAQAARSERFRQALASVWPFSGTAEETRQRLERAAGTTLG